MLQFILILMFLTIPVFSKTMEELLKEDWSVQETLLIKNEVKKRLSLSFEEGSNRLSDITKKIVPWALMEGLEPPDVARIIVYMDRSVKAGAEFDDAEDLIPLVAKKEIPIRDFVLIVQFVKETKRAGIPEHLRQVFITQAIQKKWDGYSILTGGRGLILAKGAGMNLNTTALKILNTLSPDGFKKGFQKMESQVKKAIDYREDAQKLSAPGKILRNLEKIHDQANTSDPDKMEDTVKEANKVEDKLSEANDLPIIVRPRPKKEEDPTPVVKPQPKEPELIPDFVDEEPPRKEEIKEIEKTAHTWETLKLPSLSDAIRPWVGTPYRYGGTSKSGIDCSGFTSAALTDKKVGVPKRFLPHSSRSQAENGKPVGRSDLRAGDLVFFSASPSAGKITHVGVAISGSEFAHSSNKGVGFDKFSSKHWSVRFIKARRLFKEVIK